MPEREKGFGVFNYCTRNSRKLVEKYKLDDYACKKDYNEKVLSMLNKYGGYDYVVEKAVRFYLKKTGEWSLKGDDQYCIDAQKVVDKIKNN